MEYPETARQSGKNEPSGLVSTFDKSLNEHLVIIKDLQEQMNKQSLWREKILVSMILLSLGVWIVAGLYLYSNRVTQSELRNAISEALKESNIKE